MCLHFTGRPGCTAWCFWRGTRSPDVSCSLQPDDRNAASGSQLGIRKPLSQTWGCQVLSTTVPTSARSTPGSRDGGSHHINALLGTAFLWWAKPSVSFPALSGDHHLGDNGSSGTCLLEEPLSPALQRCCSPCLDSLHCHSATGGLDLHAGRMGQP